MGNITYYIKRLYERLFYNKVTIYRKRGMKVGKNCFINTWNFLDECYLIEIGDNVQITDGVKIFTHGGGNIIRKIKPNFDCFGKVIIGNNVYIGNNAMIMPGITIGNNVVIGAGSVVTKNIPNNVVVAGNPAKKIGTIENFINKYMPYDLNCKNMPQKQKKTFLLSTPSNKFIRVKGTL